MLTAFRRVLLMVRDPVCSDRIMWTYIRYTITIITVFFSSDELQVCVQSLRGKCITGST